MRRNVSILVFVISLASAAAMPAQTLENPTLELQRSSDHYIIQPNDVLQIFVYKEPTLSGKVTVLPDGRISIPLVQDMKAAGLNPGQLKAKLEAALKEYLDIANVTVSVDAIQSYKIYVTGKVTKGGVIVSEKPISVLQALSIAGGLAEFANAAEMVVIRNSGEESTLFRINYPELIKGKNFSQNMLLRSGDVLVIP
jgi:polysaccharide export outer membrane protein